MARGVARRLILAAEQLDGLLLWDAYMRAHVNVESFMCLKGSLLPSTFVLLGAATRRSQGDFRGLQE